MVVIYPCDAQEAQKATVAAAQNGKPTYIRLAREKTPVITTEKTPFEIGKAEVYWEAKDPQVAIIATGPLVYEALVAAKKLASSKINSLVINCHTIKPIDSSAVIKAAKLAGAVVTVEEHQIAGGLGGAVSEVLVKNFPVPMEFVGMNDSFGESGDPGELLKKYNMKAVNIVDAAKSVIKRRLG
jgi:transketolase